MSRRALKLVDTSQMRKRAQKSARLSVAPVVTKKRNHCCTLDDELTTPPKVGASKNLTRVVLRVQDSPCNSSCPYKEKVRQLCRKTPSGSPCCREVVTFEHIVKDTYFGAKVNSNVRVFEYEENVATTTINYNEAPKA